MPCLALHCHAMPRPSRNADDTPTGLSFMCTPVLHALHRPAVLFCLAACKKSLTVWKSEPQTSDKRDCGVACGTVLSMRSSLPKTTGRVGWACKRSDYVLVQMVASMARGTWVGRRQCFGTKRSVRPRHRNQAQYSGADQVREHLGQPQTASGSSSFMRFAGRAGAV